jgi:predicted pyridoxine 5'-phosphate oxidase superfamily flavin-nucleotide-binding protein
MTAFDHIVREELELREIVGMPAARSVQKERSALDQHCRAFIAQSPFLLIATAGADGRCDISPKGDAPGFVLVLDDRRLAIPDRPGNKRVDGMRSCLLHRTGWHERRGVDHRRGRPLTYSVLRRAVFSPFQRRLPLSHRDDTSGPCERRFGRAWQEMALEV